MAEREIRNSLEALGNLVYLARASAYTNPDETSRYLALAENEIALLTSNLKPLLAWYDRTKSDPQ